eukprot:MONOS_15781.1-p1 / transcript=MONOS_15781.1 / gene=MONOS_15781 / organism=Monocercomonoides_exilis_PA203 / gene_product=unspecified product / transcript_product=unspecified product / location=Mono_scaffold01354:48-2809(-) / protein_length=920 / sequence_SO=supercontig / SO=protein_coding / is_pseudo=false
MNVHLQFFACLLLANMFETKGVSGSSTWKSEGFLSNVHFSNYHAFSGQDNASDAQFPSKVDDSYSFEQRNASVVKKWKSGTFSVINAFLGFYNSTVGLKNLALEYSSPSCVQIIDKSSVVMESCVSHQKSTTPFLLQSGSINIVNFTMIPQISLCSRSLVFSSDDSNSVVLRNSIMADLSISASDYFVVSGKSKSEQIDNCVFRNMSVKSDKRCDNKMEQFCIRSGMDGCLIYSCVNVFEGGISGGSFSSEEFICRNTSISFGKREMNALQKKGQMNITDSQSFSLCEWTDCTAPQGGALYVHDNENAILKVENSSFTRCDATSTSGGGILAIKIAECIVQHTTITECSCAAINTDYEGGGLSIVNIFNQPMIDNCLFNNCSSGDDGGAVDLRQAKTQRQNECIINSIFKYCGGNNSGSEGGAILHWNPIDKVIISNCFFINCYSMGSGGAVDQLINDNNNGILFYFCFFHNNTCALWGHDIVLHSSTSNNIDSSCFSTRNTSNRVSLDHSKIIDRSEWLRNDFGKVRFVSSTQIQPNSKDTYACGLDKSYPCNTISHCLTQLIPDFVTNVEVFSETISETKSVDCGTNAFTIYGQSDSTTTVQTELEAAGLTLFTVSTGTLTVNDLALVHDSAYENNRASRLFEITGTGKMHVSRLNISVGSGHSTKTAFTTELINVQGGIFHMENVNWAKTISTTSLISLSSTNEISLTFSGSTFNGIERTRNGAAVMSLENDKANIDLNSCSFEGCGSTSSENGGSMMLCVGEANEVKVEGGSFDECFCSSSNGLGGGILVQLLNENPNFQISSSFGTNTAKWGSDIFVDSIDLETTAKGRKIAPLTASLDSFDKVRGYDNGNTSLAIPLCIYLLPTPEEIYVSNTEAYDHSHCGIVQFPCLTMKHSLTRQTETKKVVVNGMILMSD